MTSENSAVESNGVTLKKEEPPCAPQHVWVGIVEEGGKDNPAFTPDDPEQPPRSSLPPPLPPPPPEAFPAAPRPPLPPPSDKSAVALSDKSAVPPDVIGGALTAQSKQELQELMNLNAGILKAGTSGILLERLSLSNIDFQTRRFSTVAMEMLREREDCDLHPYGRGGRFEGFLYDARRVKVSTDHSKIFTWLLFFFSLLLLSGSIIYLAEMDRKGHHPEHPSLNRTVRPTSTAASTTPTSVPST